MSFNRLIDPLRFNADVALRDGCAAVLQKALDKRNVEAVVLVDLRGVPFAEAVSADALIAEVVTDAGKDLLNFPRRDGEYLYITAPVSNQGNPKVGRIKTRKLAAIIPTDRT